MSAVTGAKSDATPYQTPQTQRRAIPNLPLENAEPSLVIVNNVYPIACCNILTQNWLKIMAITALIFSLALVSFLSAYTAQVWHFETFIGQIGPITSLTLACSLVVISVAMCYLSFKVKSID